MAPPVDTQSHVMIYQVIFSNQAINFSGGSFITGGKSQHKLLLHAFLSFFIFYNFLLVKTNHFFKVFVLFY